MTSTPDSAAIRAAAIEEACKPWANYHGELPDYDHPLRPVYESGVEYAVELLAKTLGVDAYTPCEGTEEYDGDLGGTLLNIVREAMPDDEHGDAIEPWELPRIVTRAQLADLNATPPAEPGSTEAGVDEQKTYEVDEPGLFCKHCGRSHIRHFYVRGVGFACDQPADAASKRTSGGEMPE